MAIHRSLGIRTKNQKKGNDANIAKAEHAPRKIQEPGVNSTDMQSPVRANTAAPKELLAIIPRNPAPGSETSFPA